MPVNLPPVGALLPVDGIQAGVGVTGDRGPLANLVLFSLAPGSVVAGVFTKNAFRAPPVTVAERRMGETRALVVNSGNANAATGARGLADAETTCAYAGKRLGLAAQQVAPFSTGVIGEFLDIFGIAQGIDGAITDLRPDGWADAAAAIMTTDTAPKAASLRAVVGNTTVTATGIAKGAGMIRPDMATMLAYLGTDAALSKSGARALARDLAARSFNRITVDGDTSTNDAFVVMATGAAGGPRLGSQDKRYRQLLDALTPLAVDLAQRIVRDGEGATKFVTVRVEQGANAKECLQVAYAIADSPLVKTALCASDPNWGRFCMAIGRAGVALDQSAVGLHLDAVEVLTGGCRAAAYTEEAGAAVLAQPEFTVRVTLGRGSATETVWTTDLSEDYVRINAEYRT